MLHALPVAADVGTVTITDRTEVRGRTPDPVTNTGAFDVDTTFDARGLLQGRRTAFTLEYVPRFTFLDLNGGTNATAAVQNGFLGLAAWKPTSKVEIDLREQGYYGVSAFTSLSALNAPGSTPTMPVGGQPVPTPTTQQVPQVQTILTMSSNTSVLTVLQLRPWTVLATVGYQMAGGANDQARLSVPFQQGPLAQATGDYKLDARNHLVTVATGTETRFTPIDNEALVLVLEEQWRHHLAKQTDLMLGAGGSYTRATTGPNQPYATTPGGTGEVSIQKGWLHGNKQGVTLSLDVRLSPVVSVLTGIVDERVQTTASASWNVRRFGLRASGAYIESIDQSTYYGVTLVTTELDASYQLTKALTVDVGSRYLSQRTNGTVTVLPGGGLSEVAGQNTFGQTVVFAALTVRFLETHF